MSKQFVAGFVALLALTTPRGEGALASEHDALVAKHSAAHGVPESLVRRVIHIESKGNPRVVSKGNYGLMQIRLGTAKAMGYSGGAEGLLDADTNMTYAVRYLAGAYRAAGGNQEQAIRNYQRGYYYSAKAQGFSPYAAPSTPPQAAAPDPTLMQQRGADRAKVAEQQRLERQAMLDARITQKKAAEQSRMAERQAMVQAREEQRRAAEQARTVQRQAALQERIDRQNALQMERVERQNAAEQRRAAQRQASLQQRLDREAARNTAVASQAAAPRVASAPPPSAGARRAPGGSYSWYNPMRYFNHPAHQAHPIQRER